ncbi:MAG: hypothetical protein U5P10_06330 [Spirochaetia bacterium]|nr:hypothetical protein [Spirochaetia bacterium]
MSRLHTFTFLLIILLFLGGMPFALSAQEEQEPDGDFQERPEEKEPPAEGYPEEEQFLEAYDLGSQIFTIDTGLYIPLFFHFPAAGDNEDVSTFEPAFGQLSLGGSGSLSWGSYLTTRFAIGVELAGSFSFTPNGYVNSLIPITMFAEYLFRYGSFEFPVSLQGGFVINRVQDQLYMGPIAIPGISGYYNLNAEWGLGLSLDYWWVPVTLF